MLENPDLHQERMLRVNRNPDKIRKTAEAHRGRKRPESTRQKQSEKKRQYIERIGGTSLNNGHKQYYDPLNPIGHHIQCRPDEKPEGFVEGNWKAATKELGIATRITKFGMMEYKIVRKHSKDLCYLITASGKKIRAIPFNSTEIYLEEIAKHGYEINLY
jgi:hypothetical protein